MKIGKLFFLVCFLFLGTSLFAQIQPADTARAKAVRSAQRNMNASEANKGYFLSQSKEALMALKQKVQAMSFRLEEDIKDSKMQSEAIRAEMNQLQEKIAKLQAETDLIRRQNEQIAAKSKQLAAFDQAMVAHNQQLIAMNEKRMANNSNLIAMNVEHLKTNEALIAENDQLLKNNNLIVSNLDAAIAMK
jgi:uncharacterized UPF0160 family protein